MNSIIIPGPVGDLEIILETPDSTQVNIKKYAVVCHPHPQFGGTMNNKVVTTCAKALLDAGFRVLRFNFRGVGNSSGSYGHITGEVEDGKAVTDWLLKEYQPDQIIFAGFSFGAYVAARLANIYESKISVEMLITIAPSVVNMDYTDLPQINCPWLVIWGNQDEVVDPVAMQKWYSELSANKYLEVSPETGHFFHGKLNILKNLILRYL